MTLGLSPLFKLRQEQTERHGYWTSATREPPHLHCQKIVGQYSSHYLLPWFYPDLNNFFFLLNLSVFTILHILLTSPTLLLIWNLYIFLQNLYMSDFSQNLYMSALCYFYSPSLLIYICLWNVTLNRSDQVPALCTAWRRWVWRGSWLWRRDWTTAGVGTARTVKCAARVERGVCGGRSMLASLCLSTLSEPFCTSWMCNAVSTHSLLSP